ncbi:MAG: hypothetical protein ACXU9C_28745, partial [Xanthobacteraceae bacterium]
RIDGVARDARLARRHGRFHEGLAVKSRTPNRTMSTQRRDRKSGSATMITACFIRLRSSLSTQLGKEIPIDSKSPSF